MNSFYTSFEVDISEKFQKILETIDEYNQKELQRKKALQETQEELISANGVCRMDHL